MRALVVGVFLGCHAGGGPVIAVSQGGLRLGAEASGGMGPAGATLGATTSVTGDEGNRAYVTFDPGWMVQLSEDSEGPESFGAFGATIGYTTNNGPGGHWAVGGWLAGMRFDDGCSSQTLVGSVSLGVRILGGVIEVFVSPKLNVAEIPCL
jgi:hypothetical protein